MFYLLLDKAYEFVILSNIC